MSNSSDDILFFKRDKSLLYICSKEKCQLVISDQCIDISEDQQNIIDCTDTTEFQKCLTIDRPGFIDSLFCSSYGIKPINYSRGTDQRGDAKFSKKLV